MIVTVLTKVFSRRGHGNLKYVIRFLVREKLVKMYILEHCEFLCSFKLENCRSQKHHLYNTSFDIDLINCNPYTYFKSTLLIGLHYIRNSFLSFVF
jgi:hypothetical protein